ncbi:hypothetical protein HETIRDRAFT_424455 [Heterobasidion irregulare TC 32-1]|uniref:Retrotransposon gag domain-containing protein n=1 Tax=Heterobasidion irregulare (strain TC 32-1) TaxID=747525 RepID=W4KRV3_HETIT|nr:uncharacterized protein HETIRDRAFT_424455 [Heterobasidion irregulare TC 32-1]ETW87776.1 hypothetical protein HETIRDRAFT_424455 [Heterobasidion irregulare TC 32-1]
MYILANPTKYDMDMNKTLLVLSYIREGTAALFTQKYYFDRELQEYKATETKVAWGMFKAFLKELATAFKDKGLEQKARQKMFTMRMGKRTADDFVTDYLITAGESGFNLESTIDYFHRAIHLEILKQIYRLLEMPTTMDDWNNPFRYNSSNAPSSMNNSVIPMAIDMVRTALTNEEQNRLRMEGYMKGQLDMFNRVMERWGTTRLRPVEGWQQEEEAMAECSWQELRAVMREAL